MIKNTINENNEQNSIDTTQDSFVDSLINLPLWSNLDKSVAIFIGRYDDKGLGNSLVSSNNAEIDYSKLPLEAIILGLALQHSFSLGNVCLKGAEAIKILFIEVFNKSKSLLSKDIIANEDVLKLLEEKSFFYKTVMSTIDSLNDIEVIKNIKAVKIIDIANESSKEITKPVIYNRHSFYIARCYNYETSIADVVKSRLTLENRLEAQSSGNLLINDESSSVKKIAEYLDALYPSQQSATNNKVSVPSELTVNWQKVAVAMSLLHNISFICGGPGTGKTTTVAKLIAILKKIYDDHNKELHIIMAAPTGKAATRMDESLNNSFNDKKYFIPDVMKLFQVSDESKLPNFRANIDSTSTIHKLLELRPGKTASKVNKNNQIIADVLIIDEASMIDVAIMAKLLEGTSKDTRIIFLGDKDQLSSVEAGSILGDICSCITDENNQRCCTLDDKELDLLSKLSGEDKSKLKCGGLAKGISQLIVSNRFDDKSSIGVLAKRVNSVDISVDSFTSINTEQNIIDAIKVNQTENDLSKRKIFPLNLVCYADDINHKENTKKKNYNKAENEFSKKISEFIIKNINCNDENFANIVFPSYASYTKFITSGMVVTDNTDVNSNKKITTSKKLSIDILAIDENSEEGKKRLNKLFDTLDKFRILGANHEGVLGVDNINKILNRKLYQTICSNAEDSEKGRMLLDDISELWFPGKVFMVTKNEREIGIFNGDIVICGYSANHPNSHRIFFKSNDNTIKSVGAHMLSSPDLGYALTIHKSQGSEFEHTMMIFQNNLGSNITKELIYTGITRAKKYLSIYYANLEQLALSCNNVVERTSNLQERIFSSND
ncbi:MAG: exodeoxyribonuclease V subunit alpha [Succinivibrionaceae bacterium]